MNLEKELDCSTIVNSIGLLVDIIGFIGLFFHKTKRINLRDLSHYYRRVSFGTPTIESATKDIFESLSKSLKEFYDRNRALDRNSWPFFTLIILGFILQLLAQFL